MFDKGQLAMLRIIMATVYTVISFMKKGISLLVQTFVGPREIKHEESPFPGHETPDTSQVKSWTFYNQSCKMRKKYLIDA